MIVLSLLACIGLNPKAVPNQDLYLDDGQSKEWAEDVGFAVVGDVRPMIPGEQAAGRVAQPGAEAAIVDDISKMVQDDRVRWAMFMGDIVGGSSTAAWKDFSRTWGLLLSGAELPEAGRLRVRAAAVAGELDRVGDDKLVGFGAAFPGIGTDIGYNRVATWYTFDQVVNGARWRIVVVDSDRAGLGSRWDEELAWIPGAMKGDYDAALVFMHHPLVTLAKGATSNAQDAPKELLETIEDSTRLGVVKAVFAGHTGANEVYLPTGRLGELYVDAGTSGAPAAQLSRWGHAEAAGFDDLKLEPLYDLALMKLFNARAEAAKFSQQTIDHANAAGTYQGFVGEFEPGPFPVVGWWLVRLNGKQARVTFRMVDPQQQLFDAWTANYHPKEGWRIGDR